MKPIYEANKDKDVVSKLRVMWFPSTVTTYVTRVISTSLSIEISIYDRLKNLVSDIIQAIKVTTDINMMTTQYSVINENFKKIQTAIFSSPALTILQADEGDSLPEMVSNVQIKYDKLKIKVPNIDGDPVKSLEL